MTDVAFLGIIISLVAINVSMLGLLFRLYTNSRPKSSNPEAIDPDKTRLGDVSVRYFKDELVKPIVEAIKESRE